MEKAGGFKFIEVVCFKATKRWMRFMELHTRALYGVESKHVLKFVTNHRLYCTEGTKYMRLIYPAPLPTAVFPPPRRLLRLGGEAVLDACEHKDVCMAHLLSVIPRIVLRSAFGSLGSAFAVGHVSACRVAVDTKQMHGWGWHASFSKTYHQMRALAVPRDVSLPTPPWPA